MTAPDPETVLVELPTWLARFLVWGDWQTATLEVQHVLREACAWAVVEATAEEDE